MAYKNKKTGALISNNDYQALPRSERDNFEVAANERVGEREPQQSSDSHLPGEQSGETLSEKNERKNL